MKNVNLDLAKYQFPKLELVDIAFPTIVPDKVLLDEAKKRGFNNSSSHKMFSKLFYEGGKVIFKKGLDKSFSEPAWLYCRALMGSYAPKHEDKAAVCAMLLSELADKIE